MALNVAILLPASAPVALTDAMPKSTSDVTILAIEPGDELPAGQIKALVWCPGTEPSRVIAMLDAHPEVEWVHSMPAGVDGLAGVIDSRLRDSPIALTNGRGAFSSSLGEYAIASMLYFNKQFKRCEANRTAKRWDKFTMNTLQGKTLGFVGYGHIAKTCAAMAAPFGMKMIALRRNPGKVEEGSFLSETFGADAADRFYSRCDFCICSLPLTPESKQSVNAKCFESMKATW